MNRDTLIETAQDVLTKEDTARRLRASCAEAEKLARCLEARAQEGRESIRAELIAADSLGFDDRGLALSRVPTPPKVVLDPEVEKSWTWKGEPIPERYISRKPSINRALLSAEMKAGTSVGFARLVVGETLKIERLAPGSDPEQEF